MSKTEYDPKVWYYSNSLGTYIRIKSMKTQHLKNAIAKLDRTVNYAFKNDIRTVENMYVRSYGFQEPVYQNLVNELAKRPADDPTNYDYVMEDKR